MSVYDILARWGVKKYKKIDKQAMAEITLGSSILAAGGGGDPEIGLLWAYNVLKNNDIILVDPRDIPNEAIATIAGCLGSALVLTEKTPNGNEVFWASEKLERYLGKKIEAVIPAEAGGVNTPIPMAVAGTLGIPVIDADGMGRAFPELQMTSFYINGVSPCPIATANEKGYVTICDVKSGLTSERIVRNAAMAYGGISWIAGYPMTGRQLKDVAILNTVTLLWNIGKAVYKCRREHTNVINEITKFTNGYECFNGKIIDINRCFGGEKTRGFTLGQVVMEGVGKYKGKTAKIDFQNEWLRILVDDEVKCLTPDLITILDPETGEPIRTDVMKYGYRGSVVLMPANKRMTTPKGIETFGPRYFGYDMDYVSMEELKTKKVTAK